MYSQNAKSIDLSFCETSKCRRLPGIRWMVSRDGWLGVLPLFPFSLRSHVVNFSAGVMLGYWISTLGQKWGRTLTIAYVERSVPCFGGLGCQSRISTHLLRELQQGHETVLPPLPHTVSLPLSYGLSGSFQVLCCISSREHKATSRPHFYHHSP